MPKKIGTVERSVLTSAALPQATSTYTVISHSYVINTIMQALHNNGFTVKEEVYKCTTDAKVAHGAFIINFEDDPDLELMYSFSNSYDKSLRFRAAVGAYVPANEGFIISEMDNWRRKHTGTADNETEELINEHIANAKEYFAQLKSDKEAMKAISIDKQTYGSILGQLFINGYLGIDQISMAAKEYDNPSFTYSTGKDNLWTCYCHIIGALRQSHPSKWMQNQVATHLFFVAKYNLSQFDEDETTEEYGPSDTYPVQESEQGFEEADSVDEFGGVILPGFDLPAKTQPVAPCAAHDLETQKEEEKVQQHTGGGEVMMEEADVVVEMSRDLDAEEDEDWNQLEEAGVITPIVKAKDTKPFPSEESEVEEIQPEDLEAAAELADKMVQPFKQEIPMPLTELNEEQLPQKEEPVEANWNLQGDQEQMEEEATAEAEASNDEVPWKEDDEETEESDESYFFQSDYPGVQVGDCFEAGEGEYYEVVDTMSSDEGDLLVCKVVDTEAFVEEEAEEAEEQQEETQEPVAEVPSTDEEFSIAETQEPISLEEEAPVDDSTPEVETEPVAEDEVPEAEEIEEEEEDIPQVPGPEDAGTPQGDPKVIEAIGNELEEIYGYKPVFTYEEKGSQYNIVLESGESIVLSTAYINSMVN